jgi:hypothetical protein
LRKKLKVYLLSLNLVKKSIFDLEKKLGIKNDFIKLIAVSKLQKNDRVEAVLVDGHRIFGENRVQEAVGKWPKFKNEFDNIELHLLGPLQSNKVRQAMKLFDFIHTVDSVKLAKRISLIRNDIGFCPKLFIQVNTGDENQKAGICVDGLDHLIETCRKLELPVVGLMCIPPVNENPVDHFVLLKKCAKLHNLSELSMGMSNDFEEAIRCGTTCVRVGSAIFGERL